MSLPGLNSGTSQQLARYIATGGLNTALGFAVIWALLAAGISDIPANAAGYAFGLLTSFFINRSWTFHQKAKPSWDEAGRFIAVFAIAYGFNLSIILFGKQLGFAGNPLLHLAGVVAYSLTGFILAKSFVYSSDTAGKSALISSPIALLLALVLIACPTIVGMPITHDVVWQFWIARQMNNGVELYTQINEVNPPLWFWMAMPVDRLGTLLDIKPINLVQLLMILLSAATYLMSNHLLGGMEQRRRLLLLGNAFALGLVIALGNFAQREQIAMIAALPYVLLIVQRVEGKKVNLGFATWIGLLAASGFALKHYFVAVPLFLEIWLLTALRWNYRPFRPENVMLVICAAAYGISMWLFALDFFGLQLPMTLGAYAGYSKSFVYLVNDREQLLWVLCLFAFLICGWFRKASFTPLVTAFWIAAGGFMVSYVAQDKGWVYHSMPVTYFLLLALIAAALQERAEERSTARNAIIALTLVLAYLFPIQFGPYNSRYAASTNDAIEGTAKGSAVYILSSDAQKSWPMIVEQGYVWPSRFMSLWMLPAIAAKMGNETELSRISNEIRRDTVKDLQCTPPVTLLIERAPINEVISRLNFDFLTYFVEEPSARKLMENYTLVRTTPKFYVYHLRPDARIDKPTGCRKIY